MEEMIYNGVRERKILEENTYKEYKYEVVSYGTHPCAYIEIPKGHPMFMKEYDDKIFEEIWCHGGLTYSDFKEKSNKEIWKIGWDYAHYNDYTHYNAEFGIIETLGMGKKWTTKEIVEECRSVIDQIRGVLSSDI